MRQFGGSLFLSFEKMKTGKLFQKVISIFKMLLNFILILEQRLVI